MTPEEILENTKNIGEFLGYQVKPNDTGELSFYKKNKVGEWVFLIQVSRMNYHKSWHKLIDALFMISKMQLPNSTLSKHLKLQNAVLSFNINLAYNGLLKFIKKP